MTKQLTIRRPVTRRRPLLRMLDMVVAIAGFTGLAVLIIKWGFRHIPAGISPTFLNATLVISVAALIGERITRTIAADDLVYHLKRNWLDVIPFIAAISAALTGKPLIAAAGIYLTLSLAIHAALMLRFLFASAIAPARLLVGSFLAIIALGAGLLCLPQAAAESAAPMSITDAIFTATSATCVTGLIVRDTATEFSLFGKSVILVMIQLGGLGLMTFGTLFIMLSGRSLGLKQSAVVGEMISEQTLGGIGRTVRFIIVSTLCIELAGAVMLHPLWSDKPMGWYNSFFHSISAFCNAGFALQSDSLISLRNRWQTSIIVPLLIVLGGLGFPVLMNLVKALPAAAKYWLHSRRRVIGCPRPFWTLQTRLVLSTTAILLAVGWAGLMILEFVAATGGAALDGGIISGSWFQSITTRTAGFNTIDLTTLSSSGKLWMILLMLIGGSPASTAGGMKTVCLAVTLLVMWSVLRGRWQVEIFGRTIPMTMARRAVTLAILFVATVLIAIVALAAAQPADSDFMDVLFEAVSACGTVGLSLGETARLTLAGKWVIITSMFIGRVGPLTLLMSLTIPTETANYSYPSERIIVG